MKLTSHSLSLNKENHRSHWPTLAYQQAKDAHMTTLQDMHIHTVNRVPNKPSRCPRGSPAGFARQPRTQSRQRCLGALLGTANGRSHVVHEVGGEGAALRDAEVPKPPGRPNAAVEPLSAAPGPRSPCKHLLLALSKSAAPAARSAAEAVSRRAKMGVKSHTRSGVEPKVSRPHHSN